MRHSFIFVALTCFALSPIAHGQDGAVGPAANGNTAEGTNALHSLSGKTTGTNNTAMGFDALLSNTNGVANTATGSGALKSNTTGTDNTAVGYQALYSNTSGAPDANGNTVGQQNTAVGSQALFSNTTGWPNTALGYQALSNNNIGFFNTGLGYQALFSNTTGVRNCATGNAALMSNTIGTDNTAIGNATLINNVSGSFNTATSRRALSRNTGSFNIGLGFWAGSNLASGDNNVYISNLGVAAEANTIRIGTQVAAADFLGEEVHAAHTATFIAGIFGATTSDTTTTTPVVIDMNGNLGTAASSERFKRDVKPMDKSSDVILALKPVTFHYKNDSKDTPQFGLIAEDVAKANPNLVVRDVKGDIYTVRYEAVNAMLLNEFLKEHRKVQELEKQVEKLTAGFQKVSDELELRKSEPRVVGN